MTTGRQIEEIEANFTFLLIEVSKQLEDARLSLDNPLKNPIDRVLLRDDHIDNLKGIIEKKIYTNIIHTDINNKKLMDFTRALNIITSNLERIGDFCVNIVNQVQYFKNASFIKRYDYDAFFEEILTAFHIIEEAVFRNDMSLAINICHVEYNLDQLYEKNFHIILRELHDRIDIENLLTTLFILRYLERIGDSLLNIGEAIISSIIGEKLKIHQIRALGETLESTEYDYPDPDFSFESIGETQSGCKIGIVQLSNKDGDNKEIIFKEGKSYKIEKEYENILKWHEISPGTPPKVHGFHSHSLNASLLMEKLKGITFQEAILNKDEAFIDRAVSLLTEHVKLLWEKTRKNKQLKSSVFTQVTRRFDDIMKVHPSFDNPQKRICSLTEASFKDLLNNAINLEKKLVIPFSTFIHGDFNVDNIICNMDEGKIHYVDLHRSSKSDYLQDVSVFLVSNYRLPYFEPAIRNKIDSIVSRFYNFANSYAKQNNDDTFDFRIALGIIRSFLTSTRFHLDDEFARSMYHRAIYLLSKLYDIKDSFIKFKFPENVLYY